MKRLVAFANYIRFASHLWSIVSAPTTHTMRMRVYFLFSNNFRLFHIDCVDLNLISWIIVRSPPYHSAERAALISHFDNQNTRIYVRIWFLFVGFLYDENKTTKKCVRRLNSLTFVIWNIVCSWHVNEQKKNSREKRTNARKKRSSFAFYLVRLKIGRCLRIYLRKGFALSPSFCRRFCFEFHLWIIIGIKKIVKMKRANDFLRVRFTLVLQTNIQKQNKKKTLNSVGWTWIYPEILPPNEISIKIHNLFGIFYFIDWMWTNICSEIRQIVCVVCAKKMLNCF